MAVYWALQGLLQGLTTTTSTTSSRLGYNGGGGQKFGKYRNSMLSHWTWRRGLKRLEKDYPEGVKDKEMWAWGTRMWEGWPTGVLACGERMMEIGKVASHHPPSTGRAASKDVLQTELCSPRKILCGSPTVTVFGDGAYKEVTHA